MSIGIFSNIVTKNKLPVAAFHVTQTDWDSYSHAMKVLPLYQKALIKKEVTYMIAHYQLNGYDHKHVQFWKGVRSGCQ